MPGLVAPEVSTVPSEVLQEVIIRPDRRLQQSIFEPNFLVPSIKFEYLRVTLDKEESSISSCGYSVFVTVKKHPQLIRI